MTRFFVRVCPIDMKILARYDGIVMKKAYGIFLIFIFSSFLLISDSLVRAESTELSDEELDGIQAGELNAHEELDIDPNNVDQDILSHSGSFQRNLTTDPATTGGGIRAENTANTDGGVRGLLPSLITDKLVERY